jgi:outer membrane protein assembly factor BamB
MIRLLAFLALAFCSLAADWPRFRGPDGLGTSAEDLPAKWTNETLRFDVKLPGEGNGSPIVAGGKVYLQTSSRDGTSRGLVCLDAGTGKLVWEQNLVGATAHTHKKNSLASSTPACDGERVYAVFWDGDGVALHAYSLDGKPLWNRKLGGFISQHGPGFSPMTINGKVIVNYDQDNAASIIAFDGKTGQEVWKAKRNAFRACYSTPYARVVDGKAEVVISSTAGLTGYDPDTGDVRWNWNWPFDGMALRTVGGPIQVGSMVVAISGDGGGSRSVVVVDASARQPKMVWEKKKDSPYVPMPVARGETLFWMTDAGIAMALDLKTGHEKYKERALSGSVSASLVMVNCGGREPAIVAISEAGKAIVYKAKADGFDKIADNDLKAPVIATPAVSDGKIYIRAGDRLICHGKRGA